MKKAISVLLCLLFSLTVLLPIGTLLLFGNITENTVVKTIQSPNEKYCAQVISNDQGALGGSTLVYVCENRKFDAFIFKTKHRKKVYQGEWGEFEDMLIYWKEDNCLVINSAEYEIR